MLIRKLWKMPDIQIAHGAQRIKNREHSMEIKLNHPELESILRKPMEDITETEVTLLLDTEAETLRQDCEYLFLQEIGKQQGKNLEQLESDTNVNPHIINNALVVLIEKGHTDTTIPVALEVLSQSEDFLKFNEIDFPDEGWSPIYAIVLAFGGNNDKLFSSFLTSEETFSLGKEILLKAIANLGCKYNAEPINVDLYASVYCLVKAVLPAYIADIKTQRISNKRLLSYLVDVAACAGLKEFEDTILSLIDKNLLDEDIVNRFDVTYGMEHGWTEGDMPSLSIREWITQKVNRGGILDVEYIVKNEIQL